MRAKEMWYEMMRLFTRKGPGAQLDEQYKRIDKAVSKMERDAVEMRRSLELITDRRDIVQGRPR